MAGNDEQAVVAFLTDPIAFLGANLVRVKAGISASGFGKPDRLSLTKINPQSASCATTSGKAANVYSLGVADSKEKTVIHAYFLDYQSGQIKHQFLGRLAAVMFTITMDGCTFGVGTASKTGVMVTHANATGANAGAAGAEGAALNIATQRDWTQRDLGGAATLLEPSAYRPAGEQIATTFGLRDSKGWHFYYQSYRRLAKSYPTPYELIGVSKFSG